jgi:pseudouridylate synthase
MVRLGLTTRTGNLGNLVGVTIHLRIHESVADALATGRPVVALESTISSTLGLPVPANREVVERCVAAIRAANGVPAMTAVLDGEAHVGVDDADLDRVLSATRKCAERDLPVAIAQGWDVGVTTVSATVALCAVAGVSVFATGGIGGVHRDNHLTGDVSADLGAIARHPVAVVTAGAKAFLDLAKTLEMFDTLGVPVLGFRTDEFPAFYSRRSGLAVQHRVESAREAAAVFRARLTLGLPGGVVVANPIPAEAEIPAEELAAAIEGALADAKKHGVFGGALTPFVLGRMADITGGRSVPANLALAENNARVAVQIAAALVTAV